jgi:hypothetical protein
MAMVMQGMDGAAAVDSVIKESPGQYRPQPVTDPGQRVEATGKEVQPADTLPVSGAAVPAVQPQRRPKLAEPGKPTLRGSDLVLNAGWELIEAPRVGESGDVLSRPGVDTRQWYDATVPGTVLTTLVDQGVYADPFFGLNNLSIPEGLNKQDYWYRTEFTVPEAFAARQLWLCLEGVNYYAEVWFNGQYLGHVTGAFIRGRFNVTRLARCGEMNVLAVKVAPPPDPGIPSEQSVKFGPGLNGGALCLDGPTFVCTEGWDWLPAIRDRCTGIWQDVVLRATGPVTLGDPQVITHLPLPDTSRADVCVEVEVSNVTRSPQAGVLKGGFEGVSFERAVSLDPGQTQRVVFSSKDYPQLALKRPRLWWPNGYGSPELYHLHLAFVEPDSRESDRRTLAFGIREMTYELGVKLADGSARRIEYCPTVARGGPALFDVRRELIANGQAGPDEVVQVGLRPGAEGSAAIKTVADEGMGPFLAIKVNGQRIMCLGGNWGMDDGLKRISRDRLEPYVRLHRDANLTMIRNWAGQSTSETFYDLCDQYGLLVWNDFWMETEGSNYAPADHDLFLRNVADTIQRFRNHPCIALWCAMNEGVPPEAVNQGNDRLIRELDGTRYYQPNSRSVNLRESGPWANQDLVTYFTTLNRGFSTEMGAYSMPSAEVMRTMMAEADLWPAGDAWAYHDFHSKGNGPAKSLTDRIARRYGEALNIEDFCRKSQMVNYETYRAIYEGYNSRLWNPCSGVLFWMSHPSWPSVIWQLYTWDYDVCASLFGAKKAAEPVHIQMDLPGCRVAVVNHLAKPLAQATASATVWDLAGDKEQDRRVVLTAAANAHTEAFGLDLPADGPVLVALELRDKRDRLLSDNLYWYARDETRLQALNHLAAVELQGQIHVRRGKTATVITGKIRNPAQTPALMVRLTLRDAKSGQRILPAFYDKNYVSLLAGQMQEFRIECAPMRAEVRVDVDGWNATHASLR